MVVDDDSTRRDLVLRGDRREVVDLELLEPPRNLRFAYNSVITWYDRLARDAS